MQPVQTTGLPWAGISSSIVLLEPASRQMAGPPRATYMELYLALWELAVPVGGKRLTPRVDVAMCYLMLYMPLGMSSFATFS